MSAAKPITLHTDLMGRHVDMTTTTSGPRVGIIVSAWVNTEINKPEFQVEMADASIESIFLGPEYWPKLLPVRITEWPTILQPLWRGR